MMKSSLLLSLIAGVWFTASCQKERVTPSSEITTEIRYVSDFTGIEVSHGLEVELIFEQGEHEVKVEANSNLHKYILTDVVSGNLRIRMKNNVRIKSHATIHVYVRVENLKELELSGAAHVEAKNAWKGEELDLDLSGASFFTGEFDANSLRIEQSGASTASTWGKAKKLDAEVSGASTLKDYGFSCDDLNIRISGASQTSLTVNKSLDIEASGASTLNYKGDGQIDEISISGASRVNKK
ncbi:MAG: DUF2807 domain-containing protein [Bacteroidetes bacterium]|nr:MAG: DUF2807 domain-containing protein [Bacteroidota bacterium]